MTWKYVERRKGCQPSSGPWVDRLLDALLPQPCVVCGLEQDGTGLCRVCRKHLPWNRRACMRCALPMPDGPDTECGACLSKPPLFDAAVAPLLYRFPADRLVQAFKFHRDLAAGRILTELLAEGLEPLLTESETALLIPVPMHRWRLAARGLNPAHDIARRCSRALGIPLAPYRLQRHRRTRTQTGLDASARRRNLRDAFRWRGPDLDGRCVALVDDVMTTGSTVTECTRVLRRAGAASVQVWALARAVSG